MMHYYCPHCGLKISWDEEKYGFPCEVCNQIIDEDKVDMIDDDYEGSF